MRHREGLGDRKGRAARANPLLLGGRGQKGWQEQKGGRAHIWDSRWVWRLVGGPQLQVVAPEDTPPGEGSVAGEQTALGTQAESVLGQETWEQLRGRSRQEGGPAAPSLGPCNCTELGSQQPGLSF